MLTQLTIRDLAVVDRLDLAFGPGLTLLTGETGAGKSILVGALQLVLGARASAEFVRPGADEAMVAAEFDLERAADLRVRLGEQDLLDEHDPARLAVRRHLSAAGRSRAYVNDRPVTMTTLAAIGGDLVDMCGQHEHTRLLDPRTHLRLLDAIGAHGAALAAVREAHAAAREARRALLDLLAASRRRDEREAFLRFQLAELDEIDVDAPTHEALSREARVLSHAEKLGGGLRESMNLLVEGENAAVGRIAKAQRALGAVAPHLPAVADVAGLLDQAAVLLTEAGRLVGGLEREARPNPARLDAVMGRLERVRRICRKHGCDLPGLLERRDAMRREIAEYESLERRTGPLRAALDAAVATLRARAEALSAARTATATVAAGEVLTRLRKLALEHAGFEIEVQHAGAGETTPDESGGDEVPALPSGADGHDRVEFLFSANPGMKPQRLAKIASGGELSRVMLALKSVLAARDPVPISVYDEVDTGIGGQVAVRVGELIRAEADCRQVVCITHLPQIAVYADRHLVVRKRVGESAPARRKRGAAVAGEAATTRVEVVEIDAAQREAELARMMGADADSATARAHAATMIARARKGGPPPV